MQRICWSCKKQHEWLPESGSLQEARACTCSWCLDVSKGMVSIKCRLVVVAFFAVCKGKMRPTTKDRKFILVPFLALGMLTWCMKHWQIFLSALSLTTLSYSENNVGSSTTQNIKLLSTAWHETWDRWAIFMDGGVDATHEIAANSKTWTMAGLSYHCPMMPIDLASLCCIALIVNCSKLAYYSSLVLLSL